MILTEEFLKSQDACEEGIQTVIDNNIVGIEYNLAIRQLIDLNEQDYAGWLIEQKKTEAYVRANGSVFTMNAYQVFNPLTGQHTRYETEQEAKSALVEIAKQVLSQHVPTVVQELANENGDTTWIPTTMHETLTVS